jgi:ABC-type phosphate transport system substrate-binding protein
MSRLTISLSLLAATVLLLTGPSAGTNEPLGLAAQSRAAADDSLAIVANRANPVENLSLDELRKIFLGDQPHWSNGRRITVVMLEQGKQERDVVLKQIYKMGEKDFNGYFLHKMFTGEVHSAPKTLTTSAEVLKFVSNVPGAIGYLKAQDVDESVKVVRIESRLPSEKDYAIRLHAKSGK